MADWATPLHFDGQGKHSNDQTEDAYAKETDDPVSDGGHPSHADHQQQEMVQSNVLRRRCMLHYLQGWTVNCNRPLLSILNGPGCRIAGRPWSTGRSGRA